MAQGKSVALACNGAGVSQQSYYHWRKECGGLEIDQAKQMKDLERENAQLKRMVADLSVEKQVLSPREISSACSAATGDPVRRRLPGKLVNNVQHAIRTPIMGPVGPDQSYLNLSRLRDNLFCCVPLPYCCRPPSWQKSYLRVDHFKWGKSLEQNRTNMLPCKPTFPR